LAASIDSSIVLHNEWLTRSPPRIAAPTVLGSALIVTLSGENPVSMCTTLADPSGPFA
jgi:hypothetical protein